MDSDISTKSSYLLATRLRQPVTQVSGYRASQASRACSYRAQASYWWASE
jgi:hypothetical protein